MISLLVIGINAVGTVNTDSSNPFGIVNSNGNSLMVGDLKTLIFWNDRTAAFQFNSATASDYFSGGIADKETLFGAIACSDKETFLYSPKRSLEAPGGEWLREVTLNENRKCSMTSNGDFAIYYPTLNKISVNRVMIDLELACTRNNQNTILSAQNKFIVFCSNGNFQTVTVQGTKSRVLKNSFRSSWQSQTRFAAGEKFMIKADSFRVDLIPLDNLDSDITETIRLSVSPCGDEEVCQPGMSRIDDSWSISGFYGHYVGQSRTFKRLPFPLASTGRGGIAFAHQKLGGRFVYLANDDGDMGTLPSANLVEQLVEPLERREFKLPFFKPNDTDSFAPSAWWSSSLGIENAWAMVEKAGLQAEPVRIAVIDTGAVVSHPGLQPQLFQSTEKLNRQDDDDNGFVDDQSGYDFVLESSKIIDLFGHGSHVGGLLVGYDPKNGILAPAAKNGNLVVLRSLDRSGKSTSIDLARALYYAIEAKVDVINCSWGGGGVTQALKDAFEAVRKANILVFSSAGNDSSNTDPPNVQPVPKLFPGVISVGATTQSGSMGSYSNWGKTTVRYLAPGDKMLSTTKDGLSGELSGTSMASPIAVSTYSWLFGVAKAKCKQQNCQKTELELRKVVLDLMCETANPRGVESRSVCGIINTEAATRALLALPVL